VGKGDLAVPDPEAVERGLGNLAKHIENIGAFGEIPIVALNRFATDADEEVQVVRRACEEQGAAFASGDFFERGGEGAIEIAQRVMEHAEKSSQPFKPLYDWAEPIKTKVAKIARAMYGAREVVWTPPAERDLKTIQKLGYEGLPVCMAKTPTSLSDNPSVVGRPEGFDVTVRSVVLAAGAGYVVPLLGDIIRMPGLPASPQASRMDLVDGRVEGLLGG
jgi:formate--tetrahydrofolate ligase